MGEGGEGGKNHSIQQGVLFASRSECLQADNENLMASQTCDSSNEALQLQYICGGRLGSCG